MANTIAKMVIDLTVEGQPEVCKRMCQAGGAFEFDPESGCVFFYSTAGPRFRIAEVDTFTFISSSALEIGTQIAWLMNGGNHNEGVS